MQVNQPRPQKPGMAERAPRQGAQGLPMLTGPDNRMRKVSMLA